MVSLEITRQLRFVLGFALLTILIAPGISEAQLTSPSASPSSVTPVGTPERSQPLQLNTDAMVFQTAIDANEYHMGPGDILQLQLWTLNASSNIAVSPDQILVVPRIGEFNVKGKTLAQVREEVYSKASEVFKDRSKTLDRSVSLTLFQPRRIIVKVTGDVLQPGDYTLTATTRANIAIDIANKPTVESSASLDPGEVRQQHRLQEQAKTLAPILGTREANPASLRYAEVFHANGTHDRIDAIRYNSMHDTASSPLLREDDVIYVPYRDPQNGMIGVYGAVQSPGDFEFVPGDSFSSAIDYALGTTANADPHHVELTRFDGNSIHTTTYDLSQTANVQLQKGDRIFVRGNASTPIPSAVVYVRGQVRTPGVYPIQDAETKLSQIIRDAGGFLPKAFYAGGRIIRRGYDQRSLAGTPEDIQQTTRLANLGVSDTANFQKQMELRTPNVVVYMDRLFGQGDSTADVSLQDGDEIVIPARPTTVFVSGFVNNSGYVGFRSGAPPSYYIDAAGGYADGAVKSGTRVIKVKTKAWVKPGDAIVEPGDEIFVPKEPEYPENYTVLTLAAVAGIVSGLGILILSVYDRTKKP